MAAFNDRAIIFLVCQKEIETLSAGNAGIFIGGHASSSIADYNQLGAKSVRISAYFIKGNYEP
jgi:hypothetical protein